MKLRDESPVDQRLSRLHRAGAGLCGAALPAFHGHGRSDGLSFSCTLAAPDPPADIPAFDGRKVPFGFVTGLVIATFGRDGRLSGELSPHEPCWGRRDPRPAGHDGSPVPLRGQRPADLAGRAG
ncbi:hypothetical protein AB0O91_06905 [Kitasatospora sp. NPDC089797]|uniref:hypothetical protein n=1 Tax=Kitasatospora sp. NPDC089797 TaxID=3155298 RepID=UPI00342C39F2